MAYDRIESQSRRKAGPTLVIRAEGKLRLSAEATSRFREAKATRVSILWDKQRRKIALQIAEDDDGTAFRLSYSKTQTSADIGARTFLTTIGWPQDAGSIDVPLEWNAEENMFEGRLPKKIESEAGA
ncbi:MAG: hypothetical protein ABI759_14620 [Candidatus Solibacter sp.]